jgi:GMP synthase (glutamine-hydrolysing)
LGPYDQTVYDYALELPQKVNVNRVLFTGNAGWKYGCTELSLANTDLLREIDHFVNEILPIDDKKHIDQMPIALLPVRCTLCENHAVKKIASVVLRPVVTNDFMTALPYLFSEEVTDFLAREILENFPMICSVFFDLTSKPPGTVEYE